MKISWAAGVDRLALLLDPKLIPLSPRPVAIILVREKSENWELEKWSLELFHKLCKEKNMNVFFAGEGTVARQFARANKYNAKLAIVIGIEELRNQQVTVKWMDEQKETRVSYTELHQVLEISP